MTSPRILTTAALAVVVSASLLTGPQAGSTPDISTDTGSEISSTSETGESAPSSWVGLAGTQRIRLEALPQVVQQGGRAASPDAAKAAITATIRPIDAGRKVWLQVQRDSYWESVTWVRQDDRGRAEFAAVAAEAGLPRTYRIRAATRPGLPAVTSESVSAARWLTPTWTDEFSGSSLSPTWHHRGQAYEGQSLRRCSQGDPGAVEVRGGAVRLSVLKDTSRTSRCEARVNGQVAGKYAYRLNGHIGTQRSFSFTYGFAAARIKFHDLRGQHGAFWMQPMDGMYPGGTGHEIDVVEYFGHNPERSGLTSFIHRYEGDRVVRVGGRIDDLRSYLRSRSDGWATKYHVFSVQWTPRMLIFRIDGKETIRIRGNISSVAQYPILSLLSSDYEIPRITDSQLPQHMYVDWVRVWETGA